MKYEDFEKFVRTHCHYETMYYDSEGRLMLITTMLDAYGMLKKSWQGLTDEEEEQIVDTHWNDPSMFIEAIETKLKEKNT